MNNQLKKEGEYLINKIRLIILSFKSDFLIPDIEETEKISNIGWEQSIKQYASKLKQKTVRKRRMIIAAACLIILLSGFAVIANRARILNKVSKSHTIHHTNTDTEVVVEHTQLKHESLEAVAKYFKLSLPILSEFPEEVTATDITTLENEITIKINAIYQNTSGEEKILISYIYFKSTEKSGIYSKLNINTTYISTVEIDVLGTIAEIYSDMERRLTVFDYDKFIINVETKYTAVQLEEMLQKIIIHKE